MDALSNMNEIANTIDSVDQIFNADQLPAGGGESTLVSGEIIGGTTISPWAT